MSYKDPDQQKAYCNNRLRSIRSQWLKENGPCKVCGSWEDLEVDHIDPSSKVDHRVWSWTSVRRCAELAKCQVLCYQCHLEKTLAYRLSRRAVYVHGTTRCYRSQKCRCPLCKAANASNEYQLRKIRNPRIGESSKDIVI